MALFSRFAVIWPRAWGEACRNLDPDMLANEWADGLARLTGEQIKRGIEQCRNTMPWPPSIAEFRSACKGGMNAEQAAFQARLAESETERKALPNGTTQERLAKGVKQASTVKESLTPHVQRTLKNIAAGKWTRDMEARYRKSCEHLRVMCIEPEWPEAAHG